MTLTDFDTLTFDCYGTLIDWESGILAALAPWRRRTSGAGASDDALLALFARHESAQQRETPALRYPELLSRVLLSMSAETGSPCTEAEAADFGAAVPHWPAFADSAEALRYLARHYRLVVLSNVDRESFRHSNTRLGVTFDHVFTAQDIGSYKPDPRNFRYMLERLQAEGVEPARILHTAQSLFHDHQPARAFGLATCWIDRRAGAGGGATPTVSDEVSTDFRFASMADMAAAHAATLR